MGVGGRSRGDPGEIHRSMGFGVQECRRWGDKGGDEVGGTRGSEEQREGVKAGV